MSTLRRSRAPAVDILAKTSESEAKPCGLKRTTRGKICGTAEGVNPFPDEQDRAGPPTDLPGGLPRFHRKLQRPGRTA